MLEGKQKLKEEVKKLLFWYEANKRDLPWRKDRDPYKIWVSEIMLQQTTARHVIPYFLRWVQKYPDLQSLSKASKKDVFELWSGLGYYNRAKNLLKTAGLILEKKEFPTCYKEWELLPGIGSYTARAISSQAFGEKVGVLDGNTIRLFSRKEGKPIFWWKAEGRRFLQQRADELIQFGKSGDVNQALMELGSRVCVAKNPQCFLCPWRDSCKAYEKDLVLKLPLKRSKTRKEIWKWKPYVYQMKDQKNQLRVAFIKNKEVPFLKGHFIFPGKAKKLNQKPKHFDFIHTITNHTIYIRVKGVSLFLLREKKKKEKSLMTLSKEKDIRWILKNKIRKESPSSLIQKTLQFF